MADQSVVYGGRGELQGRLCERNMDLERVMY